MSRAAVKVRVLSTQELGFVDLSTENRPQIVSGAIFLDGLIDLQVLQERVARIVRDNPQYKCQIDGIHEATWETTADFQLDRHLVFLGRRFESKDQLLEHAANVATVPFVGMPPWKIEAIALGEDSSQPQHVLVFYAHHALADGLEGLKLLELLSDSAKCKIKTASNSPQRRGLIGSLMRKVGSALAVAHAAVKDFARRPISSPLTAASSSSERRICHIEIPRSDLLAAKRKYATTAQSVLLTQVSQGLASYCKTRGFNGKLRAVLPYGRIASGATSFTTNNHDVGFITLPKLGSDFGQVLIEIESELDAVRREKEASVYPLVLAATSFLPRLVRRSIVHRWAKQSNVLFSILPCGRRKVSVQGRAVASICAIPAIPPSQGISVGIAIARDTVSIVLNVDPQHISDIASLREHIQSVLEESQSRTITDTAQPQESTAQSGFCSSSQSMRCHHALAHTSEGM